MNLTFILGDCLGDVKEMLVCFKTAGQWPVKASQFFPQWLILEFRASKGYFFKHQDPSLIGHASWEILGVLT